VLVLQPEQEGYDAYSHTRMTPLLAACNFGVAAKDMHVYAASVAAEDSVCLQYDAVLCNRFPTFRRNFKGLEIRDEVNSLRQSTLMKVEHVPSKLRELISQCRSDISTKNGILQDIHQDSYDKATNSDQSFSHF
jgi:hypothetical protein